MAVARSIASLAFICAAIVAAPASAEVLSLERILLPEDMAKRVAGSGVEARSCVDGGGAFQKVDIGILRYNVSHRLAIKAGLGMAKLRAIAFEPEQAGTAMSGGLSVAFWKRSGLTLSVEASAMRAAYDAGAVMDGTMLVALSGR